MGGLTDADLQAQLEEAKESLLQAMRENVFLRAGWDTCYQREKRLREFISDQLKAAAPDPPPKR